jgi:hypothetical protein
VAAFEAYRHLFSPGQRSEWAAYAVYHWYTVMGDCGRLDQGGPGGPAAQALLGRLLDAVEGDLDANPASVALYLTWASAYEVSLGLLGGLQERNTTQSVRLSRLRVRAEANRSLGPGGGP